MNLGGDDSHLMYEYPSQWLVHGSLSLIDQNLAGYNPRLFFVPFSALLIGVKATGLNVEGVVFGLTLALTYVGLSRLTIQLLGNENGLTKAAGAIAGLVVVAAPLLAETQWTSLLTAVLWEPLLPWLVLLFLWHQKTGNLTWVLTAAVAVALAAPAPNQIPWSLSCGLLGVGLCLVAAISGVYRFSLKRLLAFGAGVVAVSAFWIIPMAAAPVLHQAQFTAAVSEAGKSEAIRIIRAIAPLMSAADALSLRNSNTLMQTYGHPQIVFDQWSQRLGVLGLLPLSVTIAGLLPTVFGRRPDMRRLVVGLSLLTVLFLYFQTLRVIPGGVRLFELATRTVPGWTAERNFFDKFAIPFVEVFALTMAVCFYQLARRLGLLAGQLLALAVLAGVVLYGLPFAFGAAFQMPYYRDVAYNRVMPGLPSSYLTMLNRLRDLPIGAVLTLPLSRPAWSIVPAGQGRGVYIGLSPIYWLTGRPDYDGLDSFSTSLVPYLLPSVKYDLDHGDLVAFERLVRELGIRYVVLAGADDSAHEYYRVAAIDDPIVESSETAQLVADMAPNLIGRFGAFELREVSPGLSRPMFSLEPPDRGAFNDAYLEAMNLGLGQPQRRSDCQLVQIGVREAGPDQFEVRIPPSSVPCLLVFRGAFSAGWQATISSVDGRNSPLRLSSKKIYGFANSFLLPSWSQGKTVRVKLSYQPVSIAIVGAVLSAFSLVVLSLLTASRRLPWSGVFSGRRIRHRAGIGEGNGN
jgi:hypothetical protein